jgi:hypothetical protein
MGEFTQSPPLLENGALSALCFVVMIQRHSAADRRKPLAVNHNGNNPLIADQSGFTIPSENILTALFRNRPNAVLARRHSKHPCAPLAIHRDRFTSVDMSVRTFGAAMLHSLAALCAHVRQQDATR